MQANLKTAYLLTLAGYFGLFFLLLAWITWIRPPISIPRSVALIVIMGPLLLPLRGLLNGKTYTFSWAHFLALMYFTLGVGNAAEPATRILGIAEIIFSVMWFSGCVLYLRWQPRKHQE
ncbi:MAG: DUF2069 domain-containing protein [Thiothrix sp.]|nr:MAG: DUF2069 domain-containing protein [Thiothrix sp.]